MQIQDQSPLIRKKINIQDDLKPVDKIRPDDRASSIAITDSNIKYIKQKKYWESSISFKLKLNDMQLWCSDYQDEKYKQKAQILQLKFESEIFYDSISSGADFYCSLKNKQSKALGVIQQQEDDEILIKDQKIINAETETQVNLNNLSIQSLTVDTWANVSQLINQMIINRENYKDLIDMEQTRSRHRNPGPEGESSSDSSSDTYSNISLRSDQFKIQHSECNILHPTQIQVFIKNNQKYQRLRLSVINIDISQLLLQTSFKDIDLLYYIYRRYQQDIEPMLFPQQLNQGEEKADDQQIENKYHGKFGKPEQTSNAEAKLRISERLFEVAKMGAQKHLTTENQDSRESLLKIHGVQEDPLPTARSAFEDVPLQTQNWEQVGAQHFNILLASNDAGFIPADMDKLELLAEGEQERLSGCQFAGFKNIFKVGDTIDKTLQETEQTQVSSINVKVCSIVLSLNNSEIENYMENHQQLVQLLFDNLSYQSLTYNFLNRKGECITAIPIEQLYQQRGKNKLKVQPYNQMNVQVNLYATYNNLLSQSFEPFIEPWNVNIQSWQALEKSLNNIEIKSDCLLNMNLTYGMALTIKNIQSRILEKTFKIDEQLKKEKEEQGQRKFRSKDHPPKSPRRETTHRSNIRNTLREAQNVQQKQIDQSQSQQSFIFANYTGTRIKLCLSDNDVDLNENFDEGNNQLLQRLNHYGKKNQYEHNKIIQIKGSRYNTADPREIQVERDANFFAEQLRFKQKLKDQNSQETHDFIESEPLTMDLRVQGFSKIQIPLNIVGVYSYSMQRQGRFNLLEQENRGCFGRRKKELNYLNEHNIIVNINQDSNSNKTISIESQVLITNNLTQEITLNVLIKKLSKNAEARLASRGGNFDFRKVPIAKQLVEGTVKNINQGDAQKEQQEEIDASINRSQKQSQYEVGNKQYDSQQNHPELYEEYSIQISSQDSFRVPLIWLVNDSHVDLYVLKKDPNNQKTQAKILLFANISGIFNKKASQRKHEDTFTEGIQSKIAELNEDFYIAVDVQGYCCLPKDSRSTNPLQYVISFNPPLFITNFTMNPLIIYEIDNPSDEKLKNVKKCCEIQPSNSQFIIELDLSEENKSWIKFEIKELEQKDNLNHQSRSMYAIQTSFQVATSQQKNLEISGNLEDKPITLIFERESIPDPNVRIMNKGNCEKCQIQLQTVRKIYQQNQSYDENFDLRERLIDIGIAVKMIIYPKYMIINKTESDIWYGIDNNNLSVCKRRTNDFLMGQFLRNKLRFKVEQFQLSKEVDISTVGINGIIEGITGEASGKRNKQMQFSISIMQAPSPYTRTILLTILPRYLLVNKLNRFPILVRKYESSDKQQHISLGCNDKNQYQKEIHFDANRADHLIQFKIDNSGYKPEGWDEKSKQSSRRVQNLIKDDGENRYALKYNDDERGKKWCEQFSVDGLEDFQTQSLVKFYHYQLSKPCWYEPQPENLPIDSGYPYLITRIIVTQNTQENSAHTLIIFDEPVSQDYILKNESDQAIEFCKFDIQNGRELDKRWYGVDIGASRPFVWDKRTIKEKYIKVGYHADGLFKFDAINISVNQQKKQLESKEHKNQLLYTVEFNQSGTIEIIIETSRVGRKSIEAFILKSKKYKEARKKQQEDKIQEEKQKYALTKEQETQTQGMRLVLMLKGLGLSFIDNQPKELMYLRMDDFNLKYENWTAQAKLHEQNHLRTQTFTVINLEIGNLQLDNMIHEEMPVVFGPKKYYDKKLVDLCNNNKPNFIQNLANFYKIAKQNDLYKEKRNQWGVLSKPESVPFIFFNLQMNEYKQENTLGSVKRFHQVRFAIQELFIQVESSIIHTNLKLFMDILNVFSYQQHVDQVKNEEQERLLQRKEICPQVDASQGVLFDEEKIQVDKISFGSIQISSLRIHLTFKLEKRNFDFSSLSGQFGLIYPLIANFVSITDSVLRFNELIIIEGFYSQNKLFDNIYNHYKNQGLRQVFNILGNSDLIGNPANLLDKIGVGFYELARNPYEGIKQGPDEFIRGIGSGLQSVIGNIFGGFFQFISKFMRSLYGVLKQINGSPEIKLDKAGNVVSGIWIGIQGILIEVYQGASGIVIRPYQGYRTKGMKGLALGAAQGLGGAFISPFTAILRAGSSLSQGVSGTISSLSDLGKTKVELLNTTAIRIRPLTRIDICGQIKIYDEEIALINLLLQNQKSSMYNNQQIKFYALLPTLNSNGQISQDKKRLLVITSDYVVYLKVLNFFEFQQENIYKRSIIMCEKISNIERISIAKKSAEVIQENQSNVKRKKNFLDSQYFVKIHVNKNKIGQQNARKLNNEIKGRASADKKARRASKTRPIHNNQEDAQKVQIFNGNLRPNNEYNTGNPVSRVRTLQLQALKQPLESRSESAYSHHYSRYAEVIKEVADVNVANTKNDYKLIIFSPSKEVAIRIFALLSGLVQADLSMD